jgi:hypothetical protein
MPLDRLAADAAGVLFDGRQPNVLLAVGQLPMALASLAANHAAGQQSPENRLASSPSKVSKPSR